MQQQESHNRVQWVYSSANNQELEERYDQWASDYDHDLAEEFAWNAPQTAAAVFARLVPPEALVLDAGAGTGLAGVCLAELGFARLVAMDLSQGMLEQAREKQVYGEFYQMALGGELDFAAGQFGAVISVGVFTTGHAPASSFDELIRITAPGGHIVFSLRTDLYEEGGFKEYLAGLESAGRWRLAELSDTYQPMPKAEPEVFHRIWAYQVL